MPLPEVTYFLHNSHCLLVSQSIGPPNVKLKFCLSYRTDAAQYLACSLELSYGWENQNRAVKEIQPDSQANG